MRSPSELAASLVPIIRARLDPSRRKLIAIAGPPGSGKSTLTEVLVEILNRDSTPPPAEAVPMDGFHYDNILLDARGLRDRKGAPETFDADGFLALLRRLKNESGAIATPVFDRSIEISRGSARIVEPHHRLLIVEGNYLLLDRPVWRELKPLFDVTVFLRPDIELIEERLIKRWLDYGFARDAAHEKARGNDLVNARTILAESLAADIEITD